MAEGDNYSEEATGLEPQLTQARVPLDEAGDALMSRDASGRIPIVVVPKRSSRINPWLVLGGVAAIVAGIVGDFCGKRPRCGRGLAYRSGLS